MDQIRLGADEIKSRTQRLDGWQYLPTKIPETSENIDMLFKMYPFSDFRSAVEFVNRIAEIAEKLDHYPSLMLSAQFVNVTAWTAEINGITEKDFQLAREIGKIASKPDEL